MAHLDKIGTLEPVQGNTETGRVMRTGETPEQTAARHIKEEIASDQTPSGTAPQNIVEGTTNVFRGKVKTPSGD